MVGMYCLFVWLGLVTPLIRRRVAKSPSPAPANARTDEGGEGGEKQLVEIHDNSVLNKVDKQFKGGRSVTLGFARACVLQVFTTPNTPAFRNYICSRQDAHGRS